jgi:hypothetical protein
MFIHFPFISQIIEDIIKSKNPGKYKSGTYFIVILTPLRIIKETNVLDTVGPSNYCL